MVLRICLCIFPIALATAAAAEIPADVRSVLEEHCFACHGPEKQKGRLRLDTLSADLIADHRAAETWHDVRAVINLGEMPPEDEPELLSDQRAILLDWLNGSIEHAEEALKSKGGRVVMRRLNREEYQNTMRDLFGVDLDYITNFPPDSESADGMRNNGSTLQMTSEQLEYYLEAARSALDRILVSADSAPPEVYRHEFTEPNEKKWPKLTPAKRFGQGRKFIARIKNDYPDTGRFRVKVRVKPEFPESGVIPRMRVEVGFRPDTLSVEKILGEADITPDGPREFEFVGRIENFPLPVRGQSKYPGLVISVANAHEEWISPKRETIQNEKGKKENVFVEDPDYPYLTVEHLEFEGPLYDTWPPEPQHSLLLLEKYAALYPVESASEEGKLSEEEYIKEVLESFLPRAFRRPVSAEEVEKYAELFQAIRPEFPTLLEAVKETLVAALISPDFLYLLEKGGIEKRPLNPFEIGSRLSYFLWSTQPDEQLIRRAENGELRNPSVIREEVDRMIDSAKIAVFHRAFVEQWLDLGAMDRQEVDTSIYQGFRPEFLTDFKDETVAFFGQILRENHSATQLIDSDFLMLNHNLALHYGFDLPVPGADLRPVPIADLPDSKRSGLLTQASILLGTSSGSDSHLIKRAVFIRDKLLDDPPAPPPPNVPELTATDPKFAELSIRDQLKLHNEDAACMDCHRGIDPWGQALEELGAIGEWRTHSVRRLPNKKTIRIPVESAGELPGGHQINGVVELKNHLLTVEKEAFARAFVVKLLSYALGRSLEFVDQKAIDEITAEFLKNDLRVRDLVKSIATSELFLTK